METVRAEPDTRGVGPWVECASVAGTAQLFCVNRYLSTHTPSTRVRPTTSKTSDLTDSRDFLVPVDGAVLPRTLRSPRPRRCRISQTGRRAAARGECVPAIR